jgi:acetyltransferase-like isoleucine patch superfamily enzyme
MNSQYLNQSKLDDIGFKKKGNNIKISKNVTIVGAKNIILGSNVRIDDFSVISAKNGYLVIGTNVHIGAQTYLGCAGGLTLANNINIAQGVKIYTKSNDYVHREFNNDKFIIGKIVIAMLEKELLLAPSLLLKKI